MEPATTAQLITVAGTLGGVMLTLTANAYLERRRARDTRALETMRAKAEQGKWLRDERLSAYTALSTAGEEALQFIRNELPSLIDADGFDRVDQAESRWRELRTELRKAYNLVELLGAPETITAGREMWHIARSGGNDLFRTLRTMPTKASDQPGLHEQVAAVVSRLGRIGGPFMDACRKDLQS